MEIFIDTADINEIREAVSWGIIDGVTTNPTLVARTGKTFEQVVGEIIEVVDGPISFEAVSTKAPQIVREAKRLASIHPNVVVKIPVTEEGIKAVKVLSEQGVKTNVTLCFSPLQA
ncbi:MAG TPA: fructose-6-phosphate aldolase, partial [Proteobacteria bacterium]|nr:fructose-6-phosphate aldolase [Pseudomonadota bacterium]